MMIAPELQSPKLTKLPPPLAIPGKVRLVKDCLKVGKWLVGVDAHDQPLYWDVTLSLLREIVANFDSQYAAGIYHPLQWGHASARIGSTELASIEYIRHLWIEGNTLYFAVYVTPEVAADLQRKHRQVSVRVVDSWQTQSGKAWGPTLVHIAIVDHGAVPAQFPFVELSARQRKSGTFRVPGQRPFRKVNLSPFEARKHSEAERLKQRNAARRRLGLVEKQIPKELAAITPATFKRRRPIQRPLDIGRIKEALAAARRLPLKRRRSQVAFLEQLLRVSTQLVRQNGQTQSEHAKGVRARKRLGLS